MSQFADVGSSDECLVAAAGQDHPSHFWIMLNLFEYGVQLFPSLLIKCVEHLGAVERHVRDAVLLSVQEISQCQFGLRTNS